MPSIRVDAALRLRDLSDVPAAQVIATRLGEEQEQVSSVLSAYLRVMARLPQSEAIDPAADFLDDDDQQDRAKRRCKHDRCFAQGRYDRRVSQRVGENGEAV